MNLGISTELPLGRIRPALLFLGQLPFLRIAHRRGFFPGSARTNNVGMMRFRSTLVRGMIGEFSLLSVRHAILQLDLLAVAMAGLRLARINIGYL